MPRQAVTDVTMPTRLLSFWGFIYLLPRGLLHRVRHFVTISAHEKHQNGIFKPPLTYFGVIYSANGKMEEGSSRAAYIDEEDCLGFKIWVAELELIVAGSKGKKKPDAAQVFTLLQKLVVTLDRTERDEVKEYQRRCEAALIDVLLKGAPPPVSNAPIIRACEACRLASLLPHHLRSSRCR